jgi:hypothetical protein
MIAKLIENQLRVSQTQIENFLGFLAVSADDGDKQDI